MHYRVSAAALVALGLWISSTAASAQCSNITGNPAPTPETYAANFVKLAYLGTGPGSNDDRPLIKKIPFYDPALSFDPQNLHTVHVTMRVNTISGATMWTTSIPPSLSMWNQSGNAWIFNDPTTTYGVRKIVLRDYGMGVYIIVKLVGRNTNILNAPLLPGSDNVHLMYEIENGGTGACFDGASSSCVGSGNTQKCKV